jgi:tRNA A-37 threonylcarbamoyl transferase component Bud32
MRWHVHPEYWDLFLGSDGLRLAEWLRTGQATVVKHGPHRTVYRVQLPEGDFFLKHYRLHDARAVLRELVRPAKARMEYERARAVAARGIPTVVPLACGEVAHAFPPADSFLITRALDGTQPLSDFLEITLPALPPACQGSVRQRLAVELARFVARLHEGGILHTDFHPGNLLVRLEQDGHPVLYLIDLHAVRVSRRPLPWRVRRANLVMLNRWFAVRASRTDRLRFWNAYGRCPSGRMPAVHRERARDLEARTWQSNLRFWSGRDRRCRVENRYYQRVRNADVIGYVVRDVYPPALERLLADLDEPFRRPGVRLLKDSRSSSVAELDLPVRGVTRRVIYKRFRVTAWTDPWTALVRATAALRSWVHGQGLRERSLPTPRPLAMFHRLRYGMIYEGYLLTERVPDAVGLDRYLTGLAEQRAERDRPILRRGIELVARLLRELHRRQLSHRDLKASNVLVQPWACGHPGPGVEFGDPVFGRLWLIDLVGVRHHRKLPRSRKVQNLARLHASFWRHPFLTRTDKLRFLRVYLQWGLFGRSGWKTWWRQIEQKTRAKIERNRRSGRPLA